MYASISDAKTALINSGAVEWFFPDTLPDVVAYMYHYNATPYEAAEHFGVAQ